MKSIAEATGKIVVMDGKRFRVLQASQDVVPLCCMDTSKLDIRYLQLQEFERMLRNKEVNFVDECPAVLDYEKLPQETYDAFLVRRDMIQKIVDHYGPTYMGLQGKRHKEYLNKIAEEIEYSKPVLWRWIRQYLQSGCNDISLVDRRFSLVPKKKRPDLCNYTVKTGRPTEEGISEGVVLTDMVISQFEKYLQEFKQGREKTFINAYAGLISEYYTKISTDGQQRSVCPISERPTFRQFYNYCHKHLSQEEKDAIKTSRAEQRNNKRLLLASSRMDAIRPGWIVEVDAWEADVSIVSQIDPEQCVGRPIVYFMVDIYSRAIVAMSVSLENNSLQGITNLMINLGEDKQKYTSRFGIESFDSALWPSNFIPHEIRCDRGAEVRSDKFGKICNRLGITRTLEPPAMGSMKGLVEQCFHQLNTSVRTELENKGLITKRYDSNHHREAMLTVEDYTRMVIAFVITHNQKYLTEFLPSKEMMKTEGFMPIPVILWSYGCKKFGQPQMITEANRNQYFFDLLPEKTATISRNGITYKGLRYFNSSDDMLLKDMYVAQNQRVKFTVRIDPQDVEHVYYIRNSTLCIASLNPGYPEQMSYSGLTWQQYEEYKQRLKQMKKEGDAHNLQIFVDRRLVNQTIISNAATEHLAVTSELKAARKDERYLTNNENRMIARMQVQEDRDQITEKPETTALPDSSAPSPFTPDADLWAANKRLRSKRRG